MNRPNLGRPTVSILIQPGSRMLPTGISYFTMLYDVSILIRPGSRILQSLTCINPTHRNVSILIRPGSRMLLPAFSRQIRVGRSDTKERTSKYMISVFCCTSSVTFCMQDREHNANCMNYTLTLYLRATFEH